MKHLFKNKKLLFYFILGIIVLNVSLALYNNRSNFFTFNYWERYPKLEEKYNNSQYANPFNPEWIDDETAFAYAGGSLIQGENPVNIVPDSPPMGKYLIGLSALLFNNENIIIVLLFAILDLFLLYFLGKSILKNSLLALIPPLLFSAEPIYRNQLKDVPLFDHAQLFLLLAIFIFFNKAMKSKKAIWYFVGINLLIGAFISIKFFASGMTIVAAIGLLLLLRRRWMDLIIYIFTFPLAVLVLLSSYSWVFAYGYSVREFLGIQKWVFLYHTGKNSLFFSVWPLLLFNQWHTWWGGNKIISDPQWVITWPVTTVFTFITSILYVLKKIKRTPELEIVLIWVGIYLAFLSTGYVFSRYFLILLPFMYLISIYGIKEIYLLKIKSDKRKK